MSVCTEKVYKVRIKLPQIAGS